MGARSRVRSARQGRRVDECLTHEVARRGRANSRRLLIAFLESIIGTTHATAGVVRLLSPDGHTLQIIGSAALSAELKEEAESFVELECEASDIATLGRVVHASDISSCASRQHCPYASCRFQSLVAAPAGVAQSARRPARHPDPVLRRSARSGKPRDECCRCLCRDDGCADRIHAHQPGVAPYGTAWRNVGQLPTTSTIRSRRRLPSPACESACCSKRSAPATN